MLNCRRSRCLPKVPALCRGTSGFDCSRPWGALRLRNSTRPHDPENAGRLQELRPLAPTCTKKMQPRQPLKEDSAMNPTTHSVEKLESQYTRFEKLIPETLSCLPLVPKPAAGPGFTSRCHEMCRNKACALFRLFSRQRRASRRFFTRIVKH